MRWLVLAFAFVACGGQDDTDAFAAAFASSLRSVGGDPTAMQTYGTPNDFCEAIILEAPLYWRNPNDLNDPLWHNVDWQRFRPMCFRWGEIGALPIAEARPLILELAAEVEAK